MSLTQLPTEIVYLLVSLLDADARKMIACVNKNFHHMCNSERLWRIKYEDEFGSSEVIPFLPDESYRTRYELSEILSPLKKDGDRLLLEMFEAIALIKNHPQAIRGIPPNSLATVTSRTIWFHNRNKPITLIESSSRHDLYQVSKDLVLRLEWIESSITTPQTLHYDITVMEGKRVTAPFFMNYRHSFESYFTLDDSKRAKLFDIVDAESYIRRAIASSYQSIGRAPINVKITADNKRYFKVEYH